VIISQIEASGEVFTLTVDDILGLKKAGVSDRVISFMINTGKEDEADTDGGDGNTDVRYRSSVDDRYRTSYYDDYNDPYWNVYLSWGYGGYYDPWHYSTWWPSYSHYYYPVNCYSSYWPYYPPHSHHGGYDGAGYRRVKQGREVYGRGGSSGRSREVRGDSRSGNNPSSRTYKGRGTSGRGSSVRQSPPPSDNSGRTRKEKSPTYGGRGSGSPPPSSGGSRDGTKSQSPPPASQQSGRTMKKS
jgi:hypothetical protein